MRAPAQLLTPLAVFAVALAVFSWLDGAGGDEPAPPRPPRTLLPAAVAMVTSSRVRSDG